jgi:hypothetical protein
MIMGNKRWIKNGRLREHDRRGDVGNGAEEEKDMSKNRMWRERERGR